MAHALRNLGVNHLSLDELDKAQQYLQRSIDIRKEMFGPKHPNTINTQRFLGKATRLAGSLEDARQILESTLETQESISSDRGNVLKYVGIRNLYIVLTPATPVGHVCTSIRSKELMIVKYVYL